MSTAIAARDAAERPSIGVVTLTDRSHEALIVDPVTHPGVDTIEAVRDAGIEVRHVTDEPFIAYLAATGSLAAEQLVAGFDGEPAAFVQSDGAIAQQGDLLVEPVLFPALPQWGRPVTAIEAASAGWAVYDDTLVARPADVDGPAGVPRSAGSGDPRGDRRLRRRPGIHERDDGRPPLPIRSPGPAHTRTDGCRDVAVGRDAGVFGDGTNVTVGDFDIERLDARSCPNWPRRSVSTKSASTSW